jgi:hypothetical protein
VGCRCNYNNTFPDGNATVDKPVEKIEKYVIIFVDLHNMLTGGDFSPKGLAAGARPIRTKI